MEKNEYSFSPTFETNRGCPFTCAYCDWGVYHAKIRKFPMDRVRAEIDWFSDHKIDLVFGADSNFGLFDRDEEIIDYMVEKKRKTGYPKKFRVSYTKNTGDRVFEINKRLNEEEMSKGATLSFQSLHQETLDAIGRKNVDLDFFSYLMAKYNKEDIPTYSEIIMGLPEETYESFCEGINKLIVSGQHTSTNIYICELLPNSVMGQPDYMKKYEIKTANTVLNQYHCIVSSEDITERSTIIIENSTLPFEDWKKCHIFSIIIQCFHCLGLSRYIAIYLYYEYNIAYSDFYNGILRWMEENENTIAGKTYSNIVSTLNQFLEGETPLAYINSRFGEILWPQDEGCYLECIYNYDKFYSEFETFILQTYSNELDNSRGKDLLQYQKRIICKPFDKDGNLELEYAFYEYFNKILEGKYQKLEEVKCHYKIKQKKIYTDWKEFATEIVWWGRKGGKNHYSFEIEGGK